ncbi:MAG: UDP-N-acetylmuramoyl-tripeptide--D-alanyl-D-alanine ligase [Microgenomates group bacterium]
MQSNKIPKIIQWWVTPKLPKEHIFIPPEKRPKSLYQIFRVYSRKWLIHPIKRRIAKYYLIILQKFFDLTVIGITGSAGKTSTKDMIASILNQKDKTASSYENIDPVYNIPTTILKCRPNTRYLVLEMGVEFPGEMDFYLWLAKPSIGVITNIYPTHTLFFKSIKGVVEEKGKLTKILSKNNFAILNSEDSQLKKVAEHTKAKTIWYGKKGKVRAQNVKLKKNLSNRFTLAIGKGKISIHLPILGEQFVSNSLAAASVGYICNISLSDIKKGLEDFTQPEHRMKPIKLKSGTLVIDDSYNNNPEAAKSALHTLKKVSDGRKTIVVMGDMLELGKYEKKYHRQIGDIISSLKFDYVIGVGPASKCLVEEASKKMKKGSYYWVQSVDKVMPILRPLLKRNTTVLIKGSRSIGLDKVISQLS